MVELELEHLHDILEVVVDDEVDEHLEPYEYSMFEI
jgi:hypothetical protein